jgi:hypothetical protein
MSLPPVRAGKAVADVGKPAARPHEKKPSGRGPKTDRPEPPAPDGQALFQLFTQIRWPEMEPPPEESGKPAAAGAMRGMDSLAKEEETEERRAAPPIPVNGAPQPMSAPTAIEGRAQTGPRTDEARLLELQDLMQKLAARMTTTGEGSGFVVALSQPLFAGTSLAVRMRDGRLEVDYESSSAAEADWFADNADALTQRIEANLRRRVRMRRKPEEPES